MKYSERSKVILFGHRRNGTTLTFELFRKLENYTCFYEPFHPNLFQHADWHGQSHYQKNVKNAYSEYARVYPEILYYYKPLGAPVFPIEQELENKYFTNDHINYLEYLFNSFNNVLLQPVRINCHLKKIHQALDGKYDFKYVWILREPEGYVSSLVKKNKNIFKLKNNLATRLWYGTYKSKIGGLWSQGKAFNYIVSKDDDLFKKLKKEKLYTQLMLTWFYYFKVTVEFLSSLNDHKFAVIKYEDICNDPALIMTMLANWLELDISRIGYNWRESISHTSVMGVDHKNHLWETGKRNLMHMMNITQSEWIDFNRTRIPGRE